jgi:hypothetical protein
VDGLVLRAFGRTVAVHAPKDVLTDFADGLPPAYAPTGATPERRWRLRTTASSWTVEADDEFVFSSSDRQVASAALQSDVELWVAEHARARIFVHAGCVASDGRALVLPGRTLSGKSSLVAALVRAGATYYSDEFAVLDSAGIVRPYARKLSIRPYDGSVTKRVPVEELGGKVTRQRASVALVAALRFSPELGWSTQPLSRGEAILKLMDNTVAAQSRPRAMLTALERATAEAQCLSGTRGDADEAAARLLAMLS